MQYLFDETGRRYLDVRRPGGACCSGAARAGHARPESYHHCPLHLAAGCASTAACCTCCLVAALSLPLGRQQLHSLALSRSRSPHCALQAFGGIVTVSVGHCHPEVNAAVIEQTQRLQAS